MKNFIIELKIYPFDVMVSVAETDEQLFSQLRELEIDEEEIQKVKYADIGAARFCLFTTGQSLIRIKGIPKTPEQYGFLQHEIFHCTTSILWRIGMKFKMGTSDEAYAYLNQFLTQEIYSHINKKIINL